MAEIETDKATMEVEAVDKGTVTKILVPEGTEGVKVNTPIAGPGVDGEDAGQGRPRHRRGPPAKPAAARSARTEATAPAGTRRPSTPKWPPTPICLPAPRWSKTVREALSDAMAENAPRQRHLRHGRGSG